jgi:hypothetical protein
MKNKNKITENDTSGNSQKTNVVLKKQDLVDPNIQKGIQGLGKDVNVTVVDENIETENHSTIKYLSNVKDKEGNVSKPFTIDGRKYQMVRGTTPEKKVVMGVYCFDELNESGENIIHPVDYFDENIAKPMLEREKSSMNEEGYDFARAEREYHDKESFNDYLNLRDLDGYKHFFVNIDTGEITAKFKTNQEMFRSGIKLGPREDYMGRKTLKKFRFGEYFRNDMNEAMEAEGTDVNKLKSDVKKLTKLIYDKFSTYLSKLDKEVEKVEFLESMAEMIGITKDKMSTLATSLKSIGNTNSQANVTEGKKITKKELIETLKNK